MRKHWLLIGMMCLFGSAFPTTGAQNPPPDHPQRDTEDTSRKKTSIVNCANWGQVRCAEDEAGGISGSMNAGSVLQCYNLGNISGNRNIGGISGYASGSADADGRISNCFNSGLILGISQSGGLIGYVNNHLSVSQAYNIGNVQAQQYTGGIIGRKFSAGVSVSGCYYDNQTCLPGGIENQDIPGSAEGRGTRRLLGNSLPLDSACWLFSANHYPRLPFLGTSTAAWGAASPLLFAPKDRIDSVRQHFTVRSGNGLFWTSSDTGSLQVRGTDVIILRNDSNLTLSVGDSAQRYKEVTLLRLFQSVSFTAFYDTICTENGYQLHGFHIPASELAGKSAYFRQDTLSDRFGLDSIVSLQLTVKPSYHIAFHANQGSGSMAPLTLCADETLTLPASAFSRPRHFFIGWAFDDSGTVCLAAGDSVRIASDTTLFAVWSPDGSDSLHAIPINNTEELITFRDAVNNYSKGVFKGLENLSTGYRGRYFRLTADMDLDSLYRKGESWEPIGKSNTVSFRGTFYGDGHSVSHLYINTPETNYKGFFGCLDSACVDQLVLAAGDSIIGKQYCGGIAGSATNATLIRRCANHAYVSGASTHVGGICGNLAKSVVELCLNTGFIQGAEKTGGISGYCNGSKSGTDTLNSVIRHCYNSGQIHGGKTVGGIVGNCYSYTLISQVYHSGQVWGDTLYGSVFGSKSQKTVRYSQCWYDKQISVQGGINNTDDDNATGLSTQDLCSGQFLSDTLYWTIQPRRYPQLRNGLSDIGTQVSVLPVFLASGDNVRHAQQSIQLEGSGFVTWESNKPNSLHIQNGSASIVATDSLIVLTASYMQITYKQVYITCIQLRNLYQVRFWANDTANSPYLRTAYENSYLHLDTLPFQQAHSVFLGWSTLPQGKAELLYGDSLLVLSDTNLYASWGNDGLSPEYALSIDSLADWLAFRDAVNNYRDGSYKGIRNDNKGYRGIYFSLQTSLSLQSVCDSLHPWIPVGNSSSANFKGCFDGHSHEIDYLYADSATQAYQGIFGCVDSAEIRGISLGRHSFIRADKYIGGIVGCARNHSLIKACANHALIIGNGEYIGGICGYLLQSSIQECYNAGDISGKEKVGGICGYAGATSNTSGGASLGTSVSYCYNSNTISGDLCTGGLIGFLNGNSSLDKAYNCGQLFGQKYTGNIVGRKYSQTPVVRSCFYDKQMTAVGGINNQDETGMAEGCLTRNMTGKSLCPALDTTHWHYAEDFYPRLHAMGGTNEAWISVVPIFLEAEESADSVAHDFLLGEHKGLHWESSHPEALYVKGNRAFLSDTDTLVLSACMDSIVYRHYRIYTTPAFTTPVTRIAAETAPDIRIYPNPTAQQLHIRTPENCPVRHICLCDANGKLLRRQSVNANPCDIDLSGLPAGVYRIILYGSDRKTYPFTVSKQ
ncbi:MAG: InlB B-repeat-containing protein [Bacteroidales bacterium]|nr:InlB B-repeat-containing protein [Bacteroidales bacterium]